MTDKLAPILAALQRATKAQPVAIEQLRKIAEREEIDVVALYTLLDELHIDHKLGRVSGIRDGKSVLAYWPLVELAPDAPSTPPEPKRVHRLPAKPKAKPAAAPAKQPRKEPTMKKNSVPHGLGAQLLQHITEHPGIGSSPLLDWAEQNIPGSNRARCKYALGLLRDDSKITVTGKTAGMHYYPANTENKPADPARAPQIKIASAELESATKAAQCADLLFSDMEALNKTRNPLVRELLSDLLPDAHQLKIKLARLAGHIQQLHA